MKRLDIDRAAPGSTLTDGVFRAAASKVDLSPPMGTWTAGWGPNLLPRRATRFISRLFARVMVLDDGRGERVALIAASLHAGTRYLSERIAQRTAAEGFHVGRIVLAGAHTHSGPGNLYASPYFDAFCTSFPWVHGFHRELADDTADRISGAVLDACARLEPARVGWSSTALWEWTANRSLPAALSNLRRGQTAADLRAELDVANDAPPSLVSLERLFVDPRVQVLAAHALDGRTLGAFATFGAHNALLAREHQALSSDWFGVAEETAEALLTVNGLRPVIGLAAGAIGDVDPRPPGVELSELIARRQRLPLNLELVQSHGSKLGVVLAQTVGRAAQAPAETTLTVRYAEAPILGVTVPTSAGPRAMPTVPRIGASTLAGSELGRGAGFEGIRDENLFHADDPHFPKEDDDLLMRLIQPVLDGLTYQPSSLPLRRVQVGGVSVLGLPGEPTTFVAQGLTRQLVAAGSREVMIAATCGDYTGYFTTEREYAMQHYEGASTLWGRYMEPWLHDSLARLLSAPPSIPSGTARFDTEPFIGTKRRTLAEHRAIYPVAPPVKRPPSVKVSQGRLQFTGEVHWTPSASISIAEWGEWLAFEVDGAPIPIEPQVVLDEFGEALVWSVELREWSRLAGKTVHITVAHPDGAGQFDVALPRY